MRYSADFCFLSKLLDLTPFAPLAGLLTQIEDCICCLVHQVRPAHRHPTTKRVLSATPASGGWAGPLRYVVHYQLTLAELRFGRVVGSYVAPCARLFDTDELNVIWAELVEELGTAPSRLDLEITALNVYQPSGGLFLPNQPEM